MDFDAININLIEGATIGTIKRLLDGLDVDECTPSVRINGETRKVYRLEIEGNNLVFVAL